MISGHDDGAFAIAISPNNGLLALFGENGWNAWSRMTPHPNPLPQGERGLSQVGRLA